MLTSSSVCWLGTRGSTWGHCDFWWWCLPCFPCFIGSLGTTKVQCRSATKAAHAAICCTCQSLIQQEISNSLRHTSLTVPQRELFFACARCSKLPFVVGRDPISCCFSSILSIGFPHVRDWKEGKEQVLGSSRSCVPYIIIHPANGTTFCFGAGSGLEIGQR